MQIDFVELFDTHGLLKMELRGHDTPRKIAMPYAPQILYVDVLTHMGRRRGAECGLGRAIVGPRPATQQLAP